MLFFAFEIDFWIFPGQKIKENASKCLFFHHFVRKGRATASFVRTLQSLATHPMTAVNAALELHGAAVLLSSPVKVLGYSHEQNAKDPSETGGKGQLFEANDGQAKRAQRIRTSSFGSLDQNSGKAGQSISKGRGINRAVSLGAVGQAWDFVSNFAANGVSRSKQGKAKA